MDSQRYQQICDVFYEAEELPLGQRADFLVRVCKDDQDLRREVESMLSANENSDNFINSTAIEVAANIWAEDDKNIKIGQQIGHYKIISLLGAGGMGEVWLAEDIRLNRQLALKLVDGDIPEKDSLLRFEQEARAISKLNHPNIITIFDVGKTNGWEFIATEFIEGKTLREFIREQSLSLGQVVDIAVQICSALTAAHSSGIIHRDIKPENIMIRADGIVKVLDFGLARFSEKHTPHPDAKLITTPGMIIGTVTYMSPEQACGLSLDERTDIFSFGIVLYEMLTGKQPFVGDTSMNVLAAILNQDPEPIPISLPVSLRQIVHRSLSKNASDRPASADILGNLRAVDQDQLLIDGNENNVNFSQNPTGQVNVLTGDNSQPQTNNLTVASFRKSFPLKMVSVAFILIFTLVSVLVFYNFQSKTPLPIIVSEKLSENDQLLVAEFENKTGDEDFDKAFREPILVALDQSSFISSVKDDVILQNLKDMEKPSDTILTTEIAGEISRRAKAKAFLNGSIENHDTGYLITFEAVNTETGKIMAKVQSESSTKETVLDSVGDALAAMREKLGESPDSVKKFNAPLKNATSGSFEALKLFRLAKKADVEQKTADTIVLYKRAISIDPYFAGAYTSLGIALSNVGKTNAAKEYLEKAFDLREKLTERERFQLTDFYYEFFTGEYEKAVEGSEIMKLNYPRDYSTPLNLGVTYLELGKLSKAEENVRLAMSQNHTLIFGFINLGEILLKQSRFGEAIDTYNDGINQGATSDQTSWGLYNAAFALDNESEMQRQIELAKQQNEAEMLMLKGHPLIFAGKIRDYKQILSKAVDRAAKNAPEIAGEYASHAALNLAALGKCQDALNWSNRALNFDREQTVLLNATLVSAVCHGKTESLIKELQQNFPKNTIVNNIWLPVIRASMKADDSPEEALEMLEANRAYEAVTLFWGNYLRGKIYLKMNKAELATIEFQKILQNRGWAVESPLYVLAHLELSLAYDLQNDAPNSRKYLSQFTALIKTADSDLPVLKELTSKQKSTN